MGLHEDLAEANRLYPGRTIRMEIHLSEDAVDFIADNNEVLVEEVTDEMLAGYVLNLIELDDFDQ